MIKYCHSQSALKLASQMKLQVYRLHSSKDHDFTYSIEHGVVMNVKHNHGFYFITDSGKEAIAIVNGAELWRVCNHGDHHVHFDVFTREQILKMSTEYLTLNKQGFIIHNKYRSK